MVTDTRTWPASRLTSAANTAHETGDNVCGFTHAQLVEMAAAAKEREAVWSVVEHSWADTSVRDADGDQICALSIGSEATEETQYGLEARQRVRARLIAAAPDLLKACQQAIVALKGREHDGFLRDAIEKATQGVVKPKAQPAARREQVAADEEPL